jgi:hypothetical protein
MPAPYSIGFVARAFDLGPSAKSLISSWRNKLSLRLEADRAPFGEEDFARLALLDLLRRSGLETAIAIMIVNGLFDHIKGILKWREVEGLDRSEYPVITAKVFRELLGGDENYAPKVEVAVHRDLGDFIAHRTRQADDMSIVIPVTRMFLALHTAMVYGSRTEMPAICATIKDGVSTLEQGVMTFGPTDEEAEAAGND